jgi:hypothetical protein
MEEKPRMRSVDTAAQDWKLMEHHTRSGDVYQKAVCEGRIGQRADSMSLLIRYSDASGNFYAPRHRHDFEQIRISIDGPMDYGGGQVSNPGWVAYFPAGAYYGPENIGNASILLIQWGEYWVSREQNKRAVDELRERGEFKNGIYSYVDAGGRTKNKDGAAAVWEQVYGRELVYPTPKYPSPILMNPEAFEWVRRDDVISHKVMGRFTERDLVISKIRWDKAGELQLPSDRTYCVFTLSGVVRDGDSAYGPQTAVWSEYDQTDVLVGEEGAEAICMAFPPTALVASIASRRDRMTDQTV